MPETEDADIVFIKNLTLEMSAGIYEFEKLTKQRVIVNITLHVVSNKEKPLKAIDEVVSYERIATLVSDIAQKKHYDLLEEFVEIVAEESLKDKRIGTIYISAEKPDILAHAESVGVKIRRSQESQN